jgi:DNA-binding PadR family transcriptional regulator
MVEARMSLTELTVLGVLSTEPTHGFALSRELGGNGRIGRVLTVRRPLVYRALDRLVALGKAAPVKTEPGEAGPSRVVYAITPAGIDRLESWLSEPVTHVRDLRLAFLVKLLLLDGSGRSSAALIAAQRETLEATLRGLLTDKPTGDPVDLWRHHNALAALSFLDDLARSEED